MDSIEDAINNQTKSCSVKIDRIDKRVLRSTLAKIPANDMDASASKETYVPGKRKRRVESTPISQLIAPKRSGKSLESKSNGKKKGKNTSTTDTIDMDIVTLNCKLTNDLLNMKKSLVENLEALNHMQKQYFEKDIECLKLKTLLLEKEKQIDDLEKGMDALRDQMFCTDLIKFDTDVENQNGEMNNEKQLVGSGENADLIEFYTDAEEQNGGEVNENHFSEANENANLITMDGAHVMNTPSAEDSCEEPAKTDQNEDTQNGMFRWTPIDDN